MLVVGDVFVVVVGGAVAVDVGAAFVVIVDVVKLLPPRQPRGEICQKFFT